MNTKTWPYLLAAGALALTVGCGKGKISGTVTNTAGKALDAATVKADPAGKEATTDSAGKYALDEVSRGDQSVTASKTGYVSQTKAVKIGGTFKGDEATLDFALGSGFGPSHGLAGTKWDFTHTGTNSDGTADNGTGTMTFTSETAGSYTRTSTSGGSADSGTLTITLTHPADVSVEHTDTITAITFSPSSGDGVTATGTRKGPSMSGSYSNSSTSGTWSATQK